MKIDPVLVQFGAGVLKQLPASLSLAWDFARTNPLTVSTLLAVAAIGGLRNARPVPARRR